MKRPLFLFGDIVIVNSTLIGVVVKTREDQNGFYYEIYVRSLSAIAEYREEDVDRCKVRHKELNDEETYYQYN